MYCKNCFRFVDQQAEKALGDGEVQMVWADPDRNWICFTGDEHEPQKDNPIQFTSVDPFIMAGSGEAYHFTFKDEEYKVEDWATENAGGQDIYNADEEPVDLFDHDEQTIGFDEALQDAKDYWAELWSNMIAPVIQVSQLEFERRFQREG